MYTPTPISVRRFAVSPRTLAYASHAEMALIRLEERIRFERIRPALCRIIARLEAISTLRIDGQDPSLRLLIGLEDRTATDLDGLPSESDELDDLAEHDETYRATNTATLEALWYMRTLEWLSETIKPGTEITPELLLEIHSRCVYGKSVAETGVRFRTHEYRTPAGLAGIYSAATPEQVPELMEDLCDFINQDLYSPNTQAALAHFQFESIKPFKRGMDRTGRAMCHAILYRRGLVQTFIAPIGLMPAVDTKAHANRLLPYGLGADVEGLNGVRAIDRWVRFCAQSVELAARVMEAYITTVVGLEEGWQEKVTKTSKGSAAQELLLLLPGRPVLTVLSAMRLIDRSFSATNDALLRLENAGILRRTDSSCERNRVFEAYEVFDALEAMEGHLLTSQPIARDSFLEHEESHNAVLSTSEATLR